MNPKENNNIKMNEPLYSKTMDTIMFLFGLIFILSVATFVSSYAIYILFGVMLGFAFYAEGLLISIVVIAFIGMSGVAVLRIINHCKSLYQKATIVTVILSIIVLILPLSILELFTETSFSIFTPMLVKFLELI